ncbi:DUF7573 domain-containing protein [Natronosalvus caseinilyticus]|uniref:DUF7573 domain-containing protein n=1 Tax=Natronosalvus caseinilyticus TaxID=2953747 RepID=UPI0028AAD6C0|nr:hypothetical protein [Natronosalvus caseinilyticus]
MVLGDIGLVDSRPDLSDRCRSRYVVYRRLWPGFGLEFEPGSRTALVGVPVTSIESMVWERRFGFDKQYKPRAFVSVRVTEDSRLTDYVQDEGSSAAADTAEARTEEAGVAETDTEEADAAKVDTEEASTEEKAAAISLDETPASSAQNTVEADESDLSSSDHDAGLSTYAWGTYTCNRCDSSVDRVWRDDGDLACPSCKEW